MKRLFALLLLILAPSLTHAQPQLRVLEAPASTTWQHAATGLRLAPRIDGAVRRDIRDSTDQELDVVAAYSATSEGLEVTVYLYRTSLFDVSLWFDRALMTLRLRPEYRLEADAPATIVPFTPPSQQQASGLAAALELSATEFRSTGILVAPVRQGWLLKIRMSSTRPGADALRARLDAFARGIHWPAGAGAQPQPTAIQPCAQPLRLRRARVSRPDMADALLGSLMGAASGGRAPEAARSYCREPGASLMSGVYRPEGRDDSYIIALGDAGIALSLGPAVTLNSLEGRSPRGRTPVSMILLDRASAATWPNFDRLPPPEQALQALQQSGPVSTVQLGFGPNRGEDRNQPPK